MLALDIIAITVGIEMVLAFIYADFGNFTICRW